MKERKKIMTNVTYTFTDCNGVKRTVGSYTELQKLCPKNSPFSTNYNKIDEVYDIPETRKRIRL